MIMPRVLHVVMVAVMSAHVGQAQPTADAAAYQHFRAGLELRLGDGGWGKSRSIALSPRDCPPAPEAPCSASAKPVLVDVRFAALPRPVELYKALSTIGENMPPGRERYMVRSVPARQPDAICGGGMTLTAPMANLHVAVNIANAGSHLPVSCQWTVLGANENAQAPSGFDVLWSDTITVQVVRRP
jgi:hypothetical protein